MENKIKKITSTTFVFKFAIGVIASVITILLIALILDLTK